MLLISVEACSERTEKQLLVLDEVNNESWRVYAGLTCGITSKSNEIE